jgi:MFS transporter, DHA2 family, methylenomycin A resistance protein
VPVGLTALGLALPSIAESSAPQDRHFDMRAQVLGTLALGGFALAVIESQGVAGVAVVALAVGALALALFIKVEANAGAAALVPLDMFLIPEFRAAVIATTGMTFGMYGMLFLLPLTWQSAGMLDPVGAGLALMPMAFVFVLVSPFSGSMSARVGTRLITCGGVATIGCGLVLTGLTASSASILGAEIGLALTGLGMGLATGPLMNAAIGAVAASRSGTAAALINVARMVGAAIGVAVLGTLFAVTHAGPDGLRVAMLLGGSIQLMSATAAWITTSGKERTPLA